MQRECSEHSQSIPSIQNYVYMQSNLHKIKRSQDAPTSRQCTMRPFKGLAYQLDSFKDRLSLQPSKAQGESIFCLYTSTKQG